ncbi:hypothetical protein M514_07535 [Trichuris suis]|uniref:Uncharacterized protein n=1 Tax=Trichuris suis TaxID=68888 RepID=A0A085M360_9BILA|nr:hypothetical protein M513_07535 [Trichuris suis]KFD67802.1 hypothetical protein M514_07535 [Trichuris suis]
MGKWCNNRTAPWASSKGLPLLTVEQRTLNWLTFSTVEMIECQEVLTSQVLSDYYRKTVLPLCRTAKERRIIETRRCPKRSNSRLVSKSAFSIFLQNVSTMDGKRLAGFKSTSGQAVQLIYWIDHPHPSRGAILVVIAPGPHLIYCSLPTGRVSPGADGILRACSAAIASAVGPNIYRHEGGEYV